MGISPQDLCSGIYIARITGDLKSEYACLVCQRAEMNWAVFGDCVSPSKTRPRELFDLFLVEETEGLGRVAFGIAMPLSFRKVCWVYRLWPRHASVDKFEAQGKRYYPAQQPSKVAKSWPKTGQERGVPCLKKPLRRSSYDSGAISQLRFYYELIRIYRSPELLLDISKPKSKVEAGRKSRTSLVCLIRLRPPYKC